MLRHSKIFLISQYQLKFGSAANSGFLWLQNIQFSHENNVTVGAKSGNCSE